MPRIQKTILQESVIRCIFGHDFRYVIQITPKLQAYGTFLWKFIVINKFCSREKRSRITLSVSYGLTSGPSTSKMNVRITIKGRKSLAKMDAGNRGPGRKTESFPGVLYGWPKRFSLKPSIGSRQGYQLWIW